MATKKAKGLAHSAAPSSKTNSERTTISVKINAVPTDDTPTFYINWAEVTHTPQDFFLCGCRVPGKPSAAQLQAAKETGQMSLEPVVQLVFSPVLISGLINALQRQKDAYEKAYGVITQVPPQNQH